MFVIILSCFLCSSILAQENCVLDKCYLSVNSSHGYLTILVDRFNLTCSKAKVQKDYDLNGIQQNLDLLKDIETTIIELKNEAKNYEKDLNQIGKKVIIDRNNTNRLFESLKNVSIYRNEVNKIVEEVNKLDVNHLEILANNVSQKCESIKNKSLDFEIDNTIKNYEKIEKQFKTINKKVKNTNEKIKKTYQDSIVIKNDLDKLKIPKTSIADYINIAEKKVNETIKILKQNINLLKDLLKDSLKKNFSNNLQSNVDNMKNILKKYEDKLKKTKNYESTIDKTSMKLSDQIRKKIDDLESNLKIVDFSRDFKSIGDQFSKQKLNDFKNKIKLLKENRRILELVKEKLEKEIDLLEKWKIMQNEIERLQKNRNAILKIDCRELNITSGLLT